MATTPVMKIVEPYTPELLEGAQKYIQEWIAKQKYPPVKVLEFGSGWSTIWFLNRGCRVFSVEHNSEWYAETIKVVTDLGLGRRLDMYLSQPKKFADLLQIWRDDEIDIVYVDCIDEQRVEVARKSLQKIKPEGILILDDTHWDLWEPVLSELNASKEFELANVFDGFHLRKDGQTHYHHTTIYRKLY